MDNIYGQYRVRENVDVQRNFILKVYNWMFVGLFLTGAMAFYVGQNRSLVQIIFGNPILFYGLMFGELGLVLYLSGWVNRMSSRTAQLIFLGYSLLNGITFSFIFMAYTRSSIATSFFVTSGTFGAMSLYGYTTKKDLTGWGSFLFMGLIGIVIASLVNMFIHSPLIAWITSYIGVFIFVGLTAYDTQRIKAMGSFGMNSSEEITKKAISGALILYLDFINLFLMLLKIMGGRRD